MELCTIEPILIYMSMTVRFVFYFRIALSASRSLISRSTILYNWLLAIGSMRSGTQYVLNIHLPIEPPAIFPLLSHSAHRFDRKVIDHDGAEVLSRGHGEEGLGRRLWRRSGRRE